MFFPLRLRAPISRFHTVDPDDVIRTKVRLQVLGHYGDPDYGLTPYPDDAMFEGIKAFQKENGLEVDGVMRPAGPTEEMMHRVIARMNDNDAADKAKRGEGAEVDQKTDEADIALKWSRGQPKPRRRKDNDCDIMFAADTKICNGITAMKGVRAGQRCHASAMQRYGNCLAKRTIHPLDLGD